MLLKILLLPQELVALCAMPRLHERQFRRALKELHKRKEVMKGSFGDGFPRSDVGRSCWLDDVGGNQQRFHDGGYRNENQTLGIWPASRCVLDFYWFPFVGKLPHHGLVQGWFVSFFEIGFLEFVGGSVANASWISCFRFPCISSGCGAWRRRDLGICCRWEPTN